MRASTREEMSRISVTIRSSSRLFSIHSWLEDDLVFGEMHADSFSAGAAGPSGPEHAVEIQNNGVFTLRIGGLS